MRIGSYSRAILLGAASAGAALAQDECSTALPLAGASTPFDTTTATVSPELFPCGGLNNNALDHWYTFNPAAAGVLVTVDTVGSAFDTRLEVLTGPCGAQTSIACNDDFVGLQSQVSFVAASTDVHYVRVAGFNTASGTGVINLTQVLANDECAGALPISAGSSPFGNAVATTSPEAFSCATIGNDVWFSYTSTAAGATVTIDVCGATFDTVLEVYTGGCGALASVGCNDDFCGLSSSVSFPTPAAGTQYLVRIGGFFGSTGSGLVTVTELIPPPPVFELAITDCLPGSFIDISATGTPLNLSDDGEVDITTTVGNALLAAGLARVGSNGGVRFAGTGTNLSTSNVALPASGAFSTTSQSLLPFWDDMNTAAGMVGNIFWEEVGSTLVVQWEDAGFFNAPGEIATYQLQVHASGPAYAQFLYQDIEGTRAQGGGSATIGYQGGGIGNDVQYLFNGAFGVHNGTVLSLVDRSTATVFMTDTVPGTFIDISGTGTPLNLTDDQEVDINTTVGNSLLAAGVARVGSNGGVRFGGAGTELGFTNAAIPAGGAFSLTSQSLLPFWDDFNTVGGTVGNVYWQEIGGVLIIQWENAGFFNTASTDTATFQIQVFQGGPVVAQFLYEDIEGTRAAGGSSATVGYQSGGLGGNDSQWSFDTNSLVDGMVLSICYLDAVVGTEYCPAVANSTGLPAHMYGTGSASLAANDLELNVGQLPLNSFGFFIRGTAGAYTPMAGGGQGTICVGGTVARGVGGAILNSGGTGAVSILADLSMLPSSTGPVAATVGQTLWLQYWYRDVAAGVATSNLSNALQVKVQN